MNFNPNNLMSFPLLIQQPEPHHRPEHRDEVPARVMLAMRVLEHFTSKTAATPLPVKMMSDSEVAYEPMRGQDLTDEEAAAQATAANLLMSYLGGQFVQSKLEQQAAKQAKPRAKATLGDAVDRVVISCPTCCNNALAKMHCRTCRSRGCVAMPYEVVGDEE